MNMELPNFRRPCLGRPIMAQHMWVHFLKTPHTIDLGVRSTLRSVIESMVDPVPKKGTHPDSQFRVYGLGCLGLYLDLQSR